MTTRAQAVEGDSATNNSAQAAEGGSARRGKCITALDLHVGEHLRQARVLRGLTQTELGDRLGLTYQQVQKYEHGENRISATKLWLASRILDVPLTWFFSNIAGVDTGAPLERRAQRA